MGYRAEVDKEKCMGAGTCEALAAHTFQLNNEQIAEVQIKEDGSLPDTDEDVLAAARSCPVDAIIVKDEQGVVVWPAE